MRRLPHLVPARCAEHGPGRAGPGNPRPSAAPSGPGTAAALGTGCPCTAAAAALEGAAGGSQSEGLCVATVGLHLVTKTWVSCELLQKDCEQLGWKALTALALTEHVV